MLTSRFVLNVMQDRSIRSKKAQLETRTLIIKPKHSPHVFRRFYMTDGHARVTQSLKKKVTSKIKKRQLLRLGTTILQHSVNVPRQSVIVNEIDKKARAQSIWC
jgi:hypothetical protein